MLRFSDPPPPPPPPPDDRRQVWVPGMRRVRWVRIAVAGGRAQCQAVGTGHRLPATRTVSLETALALAADGVPTVIRCADRQSRTPLDA